MHRITIGLDIAKSIFHFFEVDNETGEITKKAVRRKELLEYLSNKPEALIGMEACGGANYWAREFIALGHEVRIISPQFVKPYVTGNKNDMIDAEAIYEALCRPRMKFVPIKTVEQQDHQMIHRVRSRLIKNRTALGNEMRGLLLEYGIALPRGHGQIRRYLVELLEVHSDRLSLQALAYFTELREEFIALDAQIKKQDDRLEAFCKQHEGAKRLCSIPGVGVVTATALAAAVGDAQNFENARQLSAWLGLVPKQHSSGGKTVLGSISKRGNCYLRQLIIHGARSVMRIAAQKNAKNATGVIRFAVSKMASLSYNKAAVAVANKIARMIWALLRRNDIYRSDYGISA